MALFFAAATSTSCALVGGIDDRSVAEGGASAQGSGGAGGMGGAGGAGGGASCALGCPASAPVCGLNGACVAVKELAAGLGGDHTCALVADGTVLCWGGNAAGQLGVSTLESLQPTFVPDLDGVTQVAVGLVHTCALRGPAGEVFCWGQNTEGQLGRPISSGPNPTPAQVTLPEAAVSIRLGLGFSCALLASGGVACWGDNSKGQLGRGNAGSPDWQASLVHEIAGAAGLEVGSYHACAVLADGGVSCWGDNACGQLAQDPAQSMFTTPVAVPALQGTTELGFGDLHSCGIQGGASCWGCNGAGQAVPSSAPNSVLTPMLVDGDATHVDGGFRSSCALLSTGNIHCWGEIGDVTVNGPAASAMWFFWAHGCLRSSDGVYACWGSNNSGQLGAGHKLAPPWGDILPIVWPGGP